MSLRGYNIYSLSQVTEMAWLTDQSNREWMVTLDTGKLNYLQDYRYADHDRAASMLAKGCEYYSKFILSFSSHKVGANLQF